MAGLHGSGMRFKNVGFGHFTKFCSPFPTDSSKELEELRSMFTRALEYLQQEVEERKWPSPLSAWPAVLPAPFHPAALPVVAFEPLWPGAGFPVPLTVCPIPFRKVSARVEIRAA